MGKEKKIIIIFHIHGIMETIYGFFKKKIKNIHHWVYAMKYIDNLSDLDKELDFIDLQFNISDDCGRAALSNFCYKIKTHDIPGDPFSQEYYDFQLRLYSVFSGHTGYDIANEKTLFSLEEMNRCHFPYFTGSASTVGDQLLAIGFIIKKTDLPANSTVLEFGPGWGNLTLALARMKHQVTCVEIEKNFIDLIKYQSRDLKNPISFFHQDMLTFSEHPDKKYDAVFFYESFHHCRDPITLIKNLPEIIHDDGIICFASEPIMSYPLKFLRNPVLPYAWGVRLDGISVWSMRRFGWMELGFETDFFMKLLSDAGLKSEHISSDISPLMNLIIARKK